MIKHGYDHCWIKIQFFRKIYQLPAVQSKEAFFIFGDEVITFHFDKMSFILRNIFHFFHKWWNKKFLDAYLTFFSNKTKNI